MVASKHHPNAYRNRHHHRGWFNAPLMHWLFNQLAVSVFVGGIAMFLYRERSTPQDVLLQELEVLSARRGAETGPPRAASSRRGRLKPLVQF